jgi:hypothetical protein
MESSFTRPWESRMQALNGVADAMHRHYSTVDDLRVNLLGQVVQRLQFFADSMFRLFSNQFTTGTLLQSDEHPATSVAALILKQVGHDLEVIQRAAEQRLTTTPPLDEILDEADYLANQLLAEVIKAGVVSENTRALTYFQKIPAVRVLPYADLALIGIPYTVRDEPRDLLTIPHELGHYVFWHGRGSSSSGRAFLFQELSDQALAALTGLIDFHHQEFDMWCYLWLEELFADIFGCWLTGPAVALSAHDMARARSQSTFVAGDSRHPVPLVRPFIYMKTLRERGTGAWTQAGQLLKAEWMSELKVRFNYDVKLATDQEANVFTFKLMDGRDVNVYDIMAVGAAIVPADQALDSLIRVIVNALRSRSIAAVDWRHPADSINLVSDLQQQYDRFEAAQRAASLNFRPAAVDWSNLPLLSFQDYALQRYDWSSKSPPSQNDQNRQALKTLLQGETPASKIKVTTWQPLLNIRDWSEGPAEIPWPKG